MVAGQRIWSGSILQKLKWMAKFLLNVITVIINRAQIHAGWSHIILPVRCTDCSWDWCCSWSHTCTTLCEETSTRESWYYTGTSYKSCSATAVVYSRHQDHWSLEEQTWPSRSQVLLFMQHTFLSSRTSFLQNSNGSPAPWLPSPHKKAAVWQSTGWCDCWADWLNAALS